MADLWQALAEEHAHLSKPDDPQVTQPPSQANVTTALHAAERSALCLSGGGVRSAMFSLGVLQELARFSWKEPSNNEEDRPPALLAEFDFLSTVSGGGYIGGWFSSWAARTSTEQVIKELVRRPQEKLNPEPLPVERIRAYASFLNPQLGLTSADTWTLGTTIIRNIILNWLVLVPLLAAVLTIPRIIDALLQIPSVPRWVSATLLLVAFTAGACSCFYMVSDLPSAGDARWPQKGFLKYCLGALCLSGVCTVLFWRWNAPLPVLTVVLYKALMVAVGAAGASMVSIPRRRAKHHDVNYSWIVLGFACLLASAAFGGWLAYLAGSLFDFDSDPHRLYAWLAFPALNLIYGLFLILLVGVTSKLTEDEDREWWARAGAWFSMLVVGWFAGMGLVLYADFLAHAPQALLLKFSGGTTVAGGLLSLLGFSTETKPGTSEVRPPSIPSKIRDLLAKLILPVFMLLLILTLSIADSHLSAALIKFKPMPRVFAELLLGSLLALLGSAAAYRVNVNKFSLNGMYRLRLIRTFLGASNLKRDASPLTGFDENDNVKMSKLRNIRPFHIVNMALNLVKAENLAWQQRKAESFTASPLHCGSMHVGYVDTERYSKGPSDPIDGFSGLSLGSALSISGAAASPNMGYHSSPLLSIVMTLFNARLGAWLANPGKPGKGYWASATPDFALRAFIDEAFGRTTDTNRWVYLSDGGHFENLGLYEMVLRRCRRIVIVDGSADPDYSFDDLANAVRKIRVDLGIEISFPNFHISKKRDKASRHCAFGEINYACVDNGAPTGEIIYIKTSLNQNEPRDVANYAEENKSFPQQPTSDQWFDEAQLESYRRLGSHVIQEICQANENEQEIYSVEGFLNQAKAYARTA